MQPEQKTDSKKVIIGVAVAALAIVGFMFVYNNFLGTASISGVVQYDGLKHQENATGENGEIVLMYKDYKSSDAPTEFARIPATAKPEWTLKNVNKGKTYVITGYATLFGTRIKDVEPLIVTAPAADEVIELNVMVEDIPANVMSQLQQTTQAASLAGTVRVNGVIPTGAQVVVSTRVVASESTDFPNSLPPVPASASVAWSWDSAVAGVAYVVKAELLDAEGALLGSSGDEREVAPSDHMSLVINSSAQDTPVVAPTAAPVEGATTAPAPTAVPAAVTISGKLDINGPVDPNSEVWLFQQIPGQTEYSQFGTIPAVDGTPWAYTSAVRGATYQIVGHIRSGGNTIAQSSPMTVAAPSVGNVLRIDTGIAQPPAPNAQPQLSNCNSIGNNQWTAQLTFPMVSGATSYWLQTGTQQGYTDVLNTKVPAPSANQSPQYNVTVNNNQFYYAQYAVTNCAECANNNSAYSAFSPTLQLKCGQ